MRVTDAFREKDFVVESTNKDGVLVSSVDISSIDESGLGKGVVVGRGLRKGLDDKSLKFYDVSTDVSSGSDLVISPVSSSVSSKSKDSSDEEVITDTVTDDGVNSIGVGVAFPKSRKGKKLGLLVLLILMLVVLLLFRILLRVLGMFWIGVVVGLFLLFLLIF